MNESSKSGCFDFGGIKGYMLDVFNKDAQKWMKEIITRNLIDQGFDGWMTDFGEWYEGASMLKGEDAHNRYINQWIQLNSELISQNERELFFFHRAGVRNVASLSQFQWYGDQTVNYGLNDGLPSVISAMQSSGFSGLPPGHSDIGGYTALRFWFVPKLERTEQLIHDWMRLEAFTPVFRTHEGLNPNDNLQVYSSDSLAKAFVFYSDINKALKPYFKKYIELYRKNGFPIFRHPVMMHDSNLSDYSVYIGDDIVLIFDAKNTDQLEGFLGFLNEDHRVSVFIRKESLALQLLSAFLINKK